MKHNPIPFDSPFYTVFRFLTELYSTSNLEPGTAMIYQIFRRPVLMELSSN